MSKTKRVLMLDDSPLALGLEAVLRAARVAEGVAKRFAWDASQDEAFGRALRDLEHALAAAVGGAT